MLTTLVLSRHHTSIAVRKANASPRHKVTFVSPSRALLKSTRDYQKQCRRASFIVRSSQDDDDDSLFDDDDEDDEEHDGTDADEFATYIFDGDGVLPDDSDPSMRLYLDSANYEEWKKWADTGMFYGFTTNPTILKRDGVKCTIPSIRQLTRLAFDLDIEELQVQAWGETMQSMYSCALDLAELDSRIVIKVPMTLEGIQTARRLVNDGVPVTFTAVYNVHQVVTALSVGAAYVAPYLGRMRDAGKDALADIADMQGIIDMSTDCSGEVRLLVASIRDADEIAQLAAQGCNTFTIHPEIAQQLVAVDLTDKAAEVFEEHAREMGSIGGI